MTGVRSDRGEEAVIQKNDDQHERESSDCRGPEGRKAPEDQTNAELREETLAWKDPRVTRNHSLDWAVELDDEEFNEEYDYDEGGGVPFGADFEEYDGNVSDPVMEAAEREVMRGLGDENNNEELQVTPCLLYTSPSPRD